MNVESEQRQFFGGSYYDVLGIPRTATEKDIKQAKKRLSLKYHPDINKTPEAQEIIRQINNAYDILSDPEKRSVYDRYGATAAAHHRPRERSSARHTTREPEPEARRESTREPEAEARRESEEEVKLKFIDALRRGPDFYARYIVLARAAGLTREKIAEFSESEEAKQIFLNNLISLTSLDKPTKLKEYLNDWNAQGINLNRYVNTKEVRKPLEQAAVKRIKWYTNDPKIFTEHATAWKEVGIDLKEVFKTAEVKEYLEKSAESKVTIFGDRPEKFVQFIRDWKTAGVDLSYVVNRPEVHSKILKLVMDRIPKPDSVKAFADYVQPWLNVGWKMPDEVRKILRSKPPTKRK